MDGNKLTNTFKSAILNAKALAKKSNHQFMRPVHVLFHDERRKYRLIKNPRTYRLRFRQTGKEFVKLFDYNARSNRF